jgi:hypothetical protein
MISRRQSTRVTRCRGCNKNIPANTPAYFVAVIGSASTNVFVCKECVYNLIDDVATDFETFDDLGEFLTMHKLSQ